MNLEELMENLKDQAKSRVVSSLEGSEPDKVVQAHISLELLIAALRHKDTTAAVLRQVVVEVARSGEWAFCKPNPDRWAGGFTSIEDFVTEAVTLAEPDSRNVKTELTGLGIVTTYADQNNVEIDEALRTWTRLRTVMPVLKIAAGKDDPDEFETIIGDVRAMSQPDLADKYTVPRNEPAGKGKIFTTKMGNVGAVIIFDHDADRERFVQKLQGIIQWGLDVDPVRVDAQNGIRLRVPLVLVDETVWADKQAA